LTYIALLREVSVGGDWWEYPTSAPSSDFTGLNPATQYEWCVISVCAGGVESLPSGTRTFQTLSGRNRNWPAPPLPGNGSLQIAKSNGVLVAEAFMNVESGKILNGGDISQAPTRPADFSADQIMPESSLTPIKEPSSATNGGNRSETETTIYIYGLANQLLAEYNGAGECMKEYIYVGTKLVAEYTPTENQYDYYTSDQINSSKLITDDTGSVVYHAAHGPYGDIQKTFTNTKDPNPKFSGKEREAYSNLDYFGARYYSSRTARFDAVDPIMNKDEAMSNPQLWNLYSYCRNNPVSFFDPDGNTEKDIVLLKALFNLRVQQMTMRKERIGNGYIGGARNNVHITQTLIVPFLLENILGIDVTWETNLKSCGDQSEAMVYSFKRASGDKEDNYESFRVLEDNWKFKTVTNSTKTHTWISGESDTGEFVKIDPLFNKFRAGKFEDNKLLYWENYSEKFREQYLNSPTKE
jgi:RHS repeat-associated protein